MANFAHTSGFLGEGNEEQGIYFSKKKYEPHPLPKFEETKNLLPAPIFDENPFWVEAYWKAWELAFGNFYEPAEGSGYVSQFLDCAFNDNIFFWDTSIQTMFLNVANGLVPGITALDNFYIKQHPSGEICREINRATGSDFGFWRNFEDAPLFSRWGFNDYFNQQRSEIIYKDREIPSPNPRLTLDALNNPIAAWAEMESYQWTGDKERLAIVWEPLTQYYEALKRYIRQGNGLYMTDWASQDNSPRNPFLVRGGTAVDTSSQMVLFARNLAEIAEILGMAQNAARYIEEAENLASLINQKMWDTGRQFYFDLTFEEEIIPIKTICAFWTLLSKTATPERAQCLVAQLQNPATFGRLHPVPSLAADEDKYYPEGGYWSGAVWPSTNIMVIRGLEKAGYDNLAREIAIKHLDAVVQVYRMTGTFWENYAADSLAPGINTNGASVVKDMVGWGGLAPILYFIEYGIGLKPNAPENQLTWKINSSEPCGCERFRFNGHIVDLIARPSLENSARITIQSDGEFLLKVSRNRVEKVFCIAAGQNNLTL